MRLYSLPNHRASEVVELRAEDIPTLPPMPKSIVTREQREEFYARPGLKHHFLSTFEGQNPRLRVTLNNPPVRIHGLLLDYDADISDALRSKAFSQYCPDGIKPAGVCRTFSGGARVLWVFERPIPYYGKRFWKAFVEEFLRLGKSHRKIRNLLPGLDTGALLRPEQYYELGTNWVLDLSRKIPEQILLTLVGRCAEEVDTQTSGPEISLDDIAREVEKRFPGRWKGPFHEGARGVRFWDPDADNPNGAWVRKHGMLAFTGEGRFLSWADIFGEDFVQKYEADRYGPVFDNVFYDGQTYFVLNFEGTRWVPVSKDDIQLHLVGRFGLNADRPKGAKMSEVQRILFQIQTVNRVEGAFPFHFCKDKVVEYQGERYLNLLCPALIDPVEQSVSWGEGFPWIAAWLDSVFAAPEQEQKEHYLAWLWHFYVSALRGQPRNGHAVFFAGPPSCGKTFWNYCVLGPMFGSNRDASLFLLGEERFNEGLLRSPVWTVDDAVPATDPRGHDKYTQIIKAVVANREVRSEEKYRKSVRGPWDGRVCVTMNDDPESIRMLPSLEHSIIDKVSFFRLRAPSVDFSGMQEKVRYEIPYFCAWLRDWKPPEYLLGDYRFGVKNYHHPDLLSTARQESSPHAFAELLEKWRREYSKISDADHWAGTSTDLLAEIMSFDDLKALVVADRLSARAVGRYLTTLCQHTSWLVDERTTKRKQWKILLRD